MRAGRDGNCGDNNVVQVGDTSGGIYWTYLKSEGKNYPPKDLTFTSRSDGLVTVWSDDSNGVRREWNLTRQPPIEGQYDDGEFSSVAAAFSSQFESMTALGLKREIRLVRVRGGRRRFETPAGAADVLRICKDGHDLVAVASPNPEPQWSVKRWNVDTGNEMWSLAIPRKELCGDRIFR